MSGLDDRERALLRQSMHDVSNAADMLMVLADRWGNDPALCAMTGPVNLLGKFLADVSCDIGAIVRPPA